MSLDIPPHLSHPRNSPLTHHFQGRILATELLAPTHPLAYSQLWLRCKSAELIVCDFPLLIPTHHWHLRRKLSEHARALPLPYHSALTNCTAGRWELSVTRRGGARNGFLEEVWLTWVQTLPCSQVSAKDGNWGKRGDGVACETVCRYTISLHAGKPNPHLLTR